MFQENSLNSGWKKYSYQSYVERALKSDPITSTTEILSPVEYKPTSKAWIYYTAAGSALVLSLVLIFVKKKK